MWDRQQIIELAIEAGAIARRHYEQPESDVKSDGTIVTRADCEIERFLTQHLESTGDDVYLLGEESADAKGDDYYRAGLQHSLYIVDPIDGTAPYAHRVPTWGVSIGFARGGRLLEGAIYLPISGELFVTEGGSVYLVQTGKGGDRQGQRLEPCRLPFTDQSLIAITQELTKRGGLDVPNPVLSLCCAIVPLSYLLVGRIQAYFGRLKLWDVAGGLPMLHKLGFDARTLDGCQLTEELSDEWLVLEPGDPRRWHLRQTCFFGAPGLAAQLLPKVRLPSAGA